MKFQTFHLSLFNVFAVIILRLFVRLFLYIHVCFLLFARRPSLTFRPRPLQGLKIRFNCVYKTVGETFGRAISAHSPFFFFFILIKGKTTRCQTIASNLLTFFLWFPFIFIFIFFEDIPISDSESFNPALWEEQRKHRAQVAFECDEDKDERETPPRVRYVTFCCQLSVIFVFSVNCNHSPQ